MHPTAIRFVARFSSSDSLLRRNTGTQILEGSFAGRDHTAFAIQDFAASKEYGLSAPGAAGFRRQNGLPGGLADETGGERERDRAAIFFTCNGVAACEAASGIDKGGDHAAMKQMAAVEMPGLECKLDLGVIGANR